MNITITEPAGTSGEIIIGIFTACVSIITFIVGAIIESRREKRRFKQEKTMRLLDEKIIAYQNMYAAILEYKSYLNFSSMVETNIRKVQMPVNLHHLLQIRNLEMSTIYTHCI